MKSKYKKYAYAGPIYYNGHKISDKCEYYTMATTFSGARRNFLFKIADGDIAWRYDIVDSLIKVVPMHNLNVQTNHKIERCEHCNCQLTDSGDCPICDYGEEDLLD